LAQFPDLHADGGVDTRVIVFGLAHHIPADRVFLDMPIRARQMRFGQISQQPPQGFGTAKALAREHSLQFFLKCRGFYVRPLHVNSLPRATREWLTE
jgi:hypothetical protein